MHTMRYAIIFFLICVITLGEALKCVNLQENGIKLTQSCVKEDTKCLTLKSLRKQLKYCASDSTCKTVRLTALPGQTVTCCAGDMCNV
ncbi:xenoxin-1-like [Xenopus laevis]|uniref:xenoxin-1-like n=1 Tax=Xenopus laevis TaxID=8355 RepID=A0A8J1LXK9_XENLA|nr:xenoxin-1-like [Xenopus laevis]XP_041433489.1 xenoxin-1-like [Xenopus laevis]XP_041433490.1 xenoxin-1-like [Xenopus laevis]OCT59151.1 hypothetical protein XELAEV_18001640mg [Xenopus laevis]